MFWRLLRLVFFVAHLDELILLVGWARFELATKGLKVKCFCKSTAACHKEKGDAQNKVGGPIHDVSFVNKLGYKILGS